VLPIRHKTCGSRLFDSLHEVAELTGPTPDIAIKCSRCSRKSKHDVIAKFRIRLPRWIGPVRPESIYCASLQCLARLCDMSFPYTQVENFGDIEIKCGKCGELTKIKLEQVAVVV